jgi:lipopolysaccharide heptosyltransferase II
VSLDLRNILLIRTDRIGDLMLSLPMLPLIRKKFPAASITVMVQAYTRELLDGHSCVDQILLYDAPKNATEFFAAARMLRSKRFDAVILPYPRFRLALLAFTAGIPVRIATGYRWYSFLFTTKIYEHRKDAKKHELEYNLGLLSVLGIDASTSVPQFELPQSPEAEATVTAFLSSHGIKDTDDFIVLHPGSGGSARDWSAENFSALGTRIHECLKMKVVVTGGKGEAALVHRVAQGMNEQPAECAGVLSLTGMGALCRRARAFVSNSTGPLHIAAAAGTPVVGFYPPIVQCSPVRWGPWTAKKKIFQPDRTQCPLCKGGPCRSDLCMNQISVDAAAEGLKELITGGGTR